MITKFAKLLSPSRRKEEGFTLIELLIVVAIIAILAAIAIPQFSAYRRRGYNSASISDLRNIRTAEEAMFADFQDYGANAGPASGTITLTGANVSTAAQTVNLSTNVNASVVAAASSGKNNTYIAKTTHLAGDTIYGADSDASAMFRQPCATAGNCQANATDLLKAPTTATVGVNDFTAPWLQM